MRRDHTAANEIFRAYRAKKFGGLHLLHGGQQIRHDLDAGRCLFAHFQNTAKGLARNVMNSNGNYINMIVFHNLRNIICFAKHRMLFQEQTLFLWIIIDKADDSYFEVFAHTMHIRS